MNAAYDLVVRNGTVVDGSGGEPYKADVAVIGARIAAIGPDLARGAQEIDASGRLVTPGFVDIHTHYDGQVTWDQRMRPSSGHGVTTVIGGNCGVGFAPCRPEQRDMLIQLMEGVEDIPEVVLVDGLPWNWETFPQFLDSLAERQYDVDVGLQVPHSPVRVYAMGQRGADREPATSDEIATMRALVAEGVRAGAFGVSTSRSLAHRTRRGDLAPSLDANEAELQGLALGLKDAGAGVFQLIPDMPGNPDVEFALMRRLVEASGRPLSFTLLYTPKEYAVLLAEQQPAEAPIRGQVLARPMGQLFGLDLSYHPFSLNPSYRPFSDLPLAEKVAALRDPSLRARLLQETAEDSNPYVLNAVTRDWEIYRLGSPPNYMPEKEDGATEQAQRLGVSRRELLYDWLLEDEGRAILFQPAAPSFLNNSMETTESLFSHPSTVIALGDGGAHYGILCDASYPSTLLIDVARDRRYGKVTLAWVINALTRRPAESIGLLDRGLIAEGLKADLNVLDLDKLHLHAPEVARDLPGGGRRLSQPADGYDATIVSGCITYREGRPTGALPGRLVRRGQLAA